MGLMLYNPHQSSLYATLYIYSARNSANYVITLKFNGMSDQELLQKLVLELKKEKDFDVLISEVDSLLSRSLTHLSTSLLLTLFTFLDTLMLPEERKKQSYLLTIGLMALDFAFPFFQKKAAVLVGEGINKIVSGLIGANHSEKVHEIGLKIIEKSEEKTKFFLDKGKELFTNNLKSNYASNDKVDIETIRFAEYIYNAHASYVNSIIKWMRNRDGRKPFDRNEENYLTLIALRESYQYREDYKNGGTSFYQEKIRYYFLRYQSVISRIGEFNKDTGELYFAGYFDYSKKNFDKVGLGFFRGYIGNRGFVREFPKRRLLYGDGPTYYGYFHRDTFGSWILREETVTVTIELVDVIKLDVIKKYAIKKQISEFKEAYPQWKKPTKDGLLNFSQGSPSFVYEIFADTTLTSSFFTEGELLDSSY